MRRVEFLLTTIRDEADNEEVQKLSDEVILEFFNRAQTRIASQITKVDETFLSKSAFIDLVAGQGAYNLPVDTLIKNRVISVERTGDSSGISFANRYTAVRQITPGEQSIINGYFIQQGCLNIVPVPTSPTASGLRINYVKSPRRVDKRRGTISSLAPLTITGFDVNVGLPDDYISIVDKFGALKTSDIFVDSFATGTGIITTTSPLTGAAIGDFVLLGPSSSTISELPDLVERYFIEGSKMMIFHKDSSSDAIFQSQVLLDIEEEIVELFSNNNRDAEYIQVSNTEYMG